MSIANLLVPNEYNIYAQSITTEGGETLGGSLRLIGAQNQIIIAPGDSNNEYIFNAQISPADVRRIDIVDNLSPVSNLLTNIINTGFDQTAARPPLVSSPQPFMIRAVSSAGFAQDNGFIRLAAGGGTNPTTTQSAIDISGASDDTDMNRNIVFWTGGVQRARIGNNGLVLNNTITGYVPTPLNYFEEYIGNAVYTGAVSTTVTNGLRIQRIGTTVHVSITSFAPIAAANSAQINVALPTRFVPTTAINQETVVSVQTAAATYAAAIVTVDNTGFAIFSSNLSGNAFTSGQVVAVGSSTGTNSVNFSYKIF